MTQIDLLPCPFCGKPPEVFPSGDGSGTMIECVTPKCVNPHTSWYGQDVAKSFWNTRHLAQSQATNTDELVEGIRNDPKLWAAFNLGKQEGFKRADAEHAAAKVEVQASEAQTAEVPKFGMAYEYKGRIVYFMDDDDGLLSFVDPTMECISYHYLDRLTRSSEHDLILRSALQRPSVNDDTLEELRKALEGPHLIEADTKDGDNSVYVIPFETFETITDAAEEYWRNNGGEKAQEASELKERLDK